MKRLILIFTATSIASVAVSFYGVLAAKAPARIAEYITYLGTILMVAATIALLIYHRKKILYRLKYHERTITLPLVVSDLLGIRSLTPVGTAIIVEPMHGTKLIAHSFVRIINNQITIDDLNKEHRVQVVQAFVRLLSSLPFCFEILPRLTTIPVDAYLQNTYSKIKELRLELQVEGDTQNPAKIARLKNLERIATRLAEGEGARNVEFIVHVMASGTDRKTLLDELSANTKTLISSLTVGLGVHAQLLTNENCIGAVREFFRASVTVETGHAKPVLTWDLAYLIPFTRPRGLVPVEYLLSGAYIGRTDEGAPVCINLSRYVNPHIHVRGVSGAGKSTAVKTLLSRYYDIYGTSILIIDYAGEYRDWVISRKGKVVDMMNATINPFELGPETLATRTQQIIDAFCTTCEFSSINQRNIFANYVSQAYRSRGFKLDDPQSWKNRAPTLSDVLDLMRADLPKLRSIKQVTVQALLQRLGLLAQGAFGIFGESNVSLSDLTNGFVCLDLSKLASDSLKDIVSWTVLQSIESTMRVSGPRPQGDLRLLVVLEEAWKLCKDENGIPVTLTKEGRKHSIGCVFVSQDISDTAEQIISNCGSSLLFRTENPRYLQFFKQAYGLSNSDVSRLRNLPVGQALMKISLHPKPFFISIDAEEVENTSDQILQSQQGNIRTVSEKADTNQTEPEQDSVDAEIMVLCIIKNKTMPITDIIASLRIGKYSVTKALNSLERRGTIKQIILPTLSTHGRNPIAYVLADENNYGRKGGIVHRYALELLKDQLEKSGRNVKLEYSIGNGKSFDLFLDDSIAIEFETGESDLEQTIAKLVECNAKRKIVCCLDKNVAEKVRAISVDRIEVIEFRRISSVLGLPASKNQPRGEPYKRG